MDRKDYIAEIERWHRERIEEVKGPSGWLNLAGLYELMEGENTFGADPSNDIVFPERKAPPLIGSFLLEGKEVGIEVKRGVDVLHEDQAIKAMNLQSSSPSHMANPWAR